MSGSVSASGLITGIDSSSIISKLVQVAQQPITGLQNQITALQSQKTAIQDFRTQLLALETSAQALTDGSLFNQYSTTSSDTSVLSATPSGTSSVLGAYSIQVNSLASSTVANSSSKLGAAIDPTVALDSSGMGTAVTAGTFTINGVQFTVDPTTDSLNTILSNINSSAAGVTATYNSSTDTVTLSNTTAGNTNLINLGATGDTSNFLSALDVTGATQTTDGNGSTTLTSTKNLGAIDPGATLNTVNFASGALTSGSFQINGVSIAVDPTTESLSDVLAKINSSDAQVTASYNSANDTIQVVSNTLGSRTIAFTSGTSNFLDVTNLTGATQTAGSDAQYSINGGAVQTSNTNTISNAIGGVSLSLLSTGTSTVTVASDTSSIVSAVQDFIKQYNTTMTQIASVTGSGGALQFDTPTEQVGNYLNSTIFGQVSGLTGPNSSLVDLGITTGTSGTFDPAATPQLSLDQTTLSAALQSDPQNVANIFTNSSGTGIMDQLSTYLDSITSYTGYLNQESMSNGTIDQQIGDLNNQISQVQDSVNQYQQRLQTEFTQLEMIAAQYQAQGATFTNLASSFGSATGTSSNLSSSLLNTYAGNTTTG